MVRIILIWEYANESQGIEDRIVGHLYKHFILSWLNTELLLPVLKVSENKKNWMGGCNWNVAGPQIRSSELFLLLSSLKYFW